MNAILHKIVIFGRADEIRNVDLKPGLNIITGDSKTGKSALIEIVDYCLFSSRSTIPKGIIDKFAEMFAVILKVSDKYISIARPNSSNGSGGDVYLRFETDDNFLANLNKEYFTSTQAKKLKDAQEEVERHLGLSISDTRTDSEEDKRNAGKVTLRSMVSLLFQHQNLIANKHSLFYRFEDFNKRKKTIADFPIFIGWESNEYFLIRRELEQKRKELRIEEKLIEKLKINDEELSEKIRLLLKSYFVFIGMELDDNLSIRQLKDISYNLPSISINSFSNSNLKLEIENKESKRFDLKEVLSEKEILLRELSNNNVLSHTYSNRLRSIDQVLIEETKDDNLKCPVCSNQVTEITSIVNSLSESKTKLKTELSKIGTYEIDNSGQIESLQKDRDSLKRQIAILSSEIQKLEEQDEIFIKNKSLIEQANILKGATDANIKQLVKQNTMVKGSSSIEEIKERIKWLQEKLEGFDVTTKIKEAEGFLADRMTAVCEKLDFETELRPGRLQFRLEDFSFYYHFNEKEKILLSEMGSGANWLACHLSIFIAFLHLNCKSKKSSIPSFLMIDQPSQVYFPRAYKDTDGMEGELDENIKQVKNIFTVLKDELEFIKKDCGFLPQIIVMDHADEPEFESYVRKRWKNGGEKLI
ncbi:hypothetical protein CJ739_3158 [Mariniflexile rhizosphaerae]|uniref:DUF3732 domain-containing protein n=1 Tax=unclassified Mariniflexile TaxID=2643887 RepID=UPI000CBA2B1F|nr:DUF3732 domain-containing protein [Mariniflexile sp. TRM1-10]AXP82220.1 hypothetical protein CJ739_3158 [Mariniflexile sp. TRM1-10]PLB19215.1 MAG: hypothetical protein TRG1_1919 [Flavobacteriaceae bacterium FS1-H7996/R]